MEDKYYVIYMTGDGEPRVREFTKEGLEAEMAEEGSGYDNMQTMTHLGPNDYDPNYWADARLIIKGRIVQPQPKQVVTQYELP